MAKQKANQKGRIRTSYKTLIIDSVNYKTLYNQKFINRKEWAEKDESKLEAFIPGKIVKVQVKEGEGVKQGDTLLILEAMKMNNRIMAPRDAIIKKIYVKENDVVSKNHLLIELE
jgi:biotin carboxyl carrier protein